MRLTQFSLGPLVGLCLAATASAPAFALNSQASFAYTYPPNVYGPQEFILNGGTTTLTATNTGWYDQNGNHSAGNPDYIVGLCGSSDSCSGGDVRFNNFFVFNLSGITGPITSAQLSLGQPTINGYYGPAGGLSYTNYDVTTPIATLIADNSGATGIYNDLGSGVAYGSTLIGPSSDGNQVVVDLNSAALAAITGAEGGSFAIGGTLASAASAPGPVPGAGFASLAALAVAGLYARTRRA